MAYTENFSLEGKVALITGASYGIGYAIAKGLAAAGAKIVFNDIKQEFVDRGLASYAADGIDAKGYVCDVTDEAAVMDMVAKIEKEVGVVDILVNNAGIIKRIPMIEMIPALLTRMSTTPTSFSMVAIRLLTASSSVTSQT